MRNRGGSRSRPGMTRTIALCLCVAACGSQADGDFQGEVLATLGGSLRSVRASPLPDPEVAVVWTQRSKMGGLVGAEKVSASGLFPQFTIEIFNPPPADILEELDGDLLAAAYVVVGSVDTDYTSYTGWRGVDLDRMLVYLPQPTTPGSTLEGFLHGPQDAGFHIYAVHHLTPEEYQARLDCVNAIPHPGRMLSEHDIYTVCGGAGRDELTATPGDLDTQLDGEIVEDDGVIELINKLPWW